ncbi:beta-propeller domain-containing protein [Hespellia stercorisuis]|uniref:Secreted protein containing C-terminal beta-propeller domain n=1 Tax=Hespellia stercorisuis DSM 15480 TaxID=1121950 RepID=A0A1M6JFU1_9FIRM|nr:beta-propeller domain-containing protein [Hespellia stercorisuis]SHJ45462.1 Secreted protein containing C-terminal beta-propeller domain [Hespellia stercorisuis DSM 15480]
MNQNEELHNEDQGIDAIKELQENIQAEDVPVPESLKPENIELILEPKRTKKWKNVYAYAAAAACVCLVAGVAAVGGLGNKNTDGQNQVASGRAGKSAEESTSSADAEGETTADGDASQIETASGYDKIYEYLQKQNDNSANGKAAMYAENATAATADSSAATTEAGQSSSGAVQSSEMISGADYSETNVREDGVGEGDIVKTDGKYLYVLTGGKVRIVDIQQQDMKDTAQITAGENVQISNIYLQDGKLFTFYSETKTTDGKDLDYGSSYQEYTTVKTYDVGNPAKPKEIGAITQSGSYYTMRAVGDYIYLFSEFYARGGAKDDIDAYVPKIQGESILSDNILLPPYDVGSQYMVVSTFDQSRPDEVLDSKGIFSRGGLCYVSSENIYMCESLYDSSQDYDQTAIRKIGFKDGHLTAVGQTKVDGVLNDSFSLDEYEGNLRLVTTITPTRNDETIVLFGDSASDSAVEEENSKETNALYVLDKKLGQLSRLDNIAEGETVYSARFMGDTGYFVTYKQMDPLFSVDLSDPGNPEIIGELKIPGFSEYLHPYGENLLLGIGMDVDETGTTTNGVKISMFNIEDAANVSEEQKSVLENMYSSDVFYDYKAVLIDAERNLIGFSAYGNGAHYLVYAYDRQAGFTCKLDREISNTSGSIRGVYVDDTLYIIEGNAVEAYDLTTFDKLDDIVL